MNNSKVWEKIGKIIYWFIWPGLFVSLRGTDRSRIVVKHGKEVLVIKDWLGKGEWKLPGGGVHRGESPIRSASRELSEEVGISVNEKVLKFIDKIPSHNIRANNTLYCYAHLVKKKPKVKTQLFEVLKAEWMELDTLLKDVNISPNTRNVLNLIKERKL